MVVAIGSRVLVVMKYLSSSLRGRQTSIGGRDEQWSITLTLGTRRRGICRVVRSSRTCATAAHDDDRAYGSGRDEFPERGRGAPLLQAVEDRAGRWANDEIFRACRLPLSPLGHACRGDRFRAALPAIG